MSEHVGAQVSKIEPLTGSNYNVWALKVSAVLKSKRLYKPIIEGNEVPDVGADGTVERKARLKWEEQNDDTFSTIVLTLSTEQASLFINESDAKKVWLDIKNTYAGKAEDRKIDVMMDLKDLKMRDNERVDDFIIRAKSLATKCSSLGLTIRERELVFYVVRGLNSKLDNVAAILRPQRSATLEDIQQVLIEEESRLDKARKGKFEQAYRAKDENRGKGGQYNKKRCFVCNKMGHLAEQCWHRKTEEGGQGHKPKYNNYSKFQGKKFRDNKNDHARFASVSNVEHAFEASERLPNEMVNQNWSLDSGCTSHMTPYPEWISDMEPISSEVILAGENNKIKVVGKGNIKVMTVNREGETKDICIHNVLYVPELRSNLLSVSSLVKQGNTVMFDEQGASIFNKEHELIAEAIEVNRMYLVNTIKEDDSRDLRVHCMNVETEKLDKINNTELWHRRLGHVNYRYMMQMQNENMVRGLETKGQKMGICESCIMGKLKRNSFPTIDGNNATQVLKRLNMDLCGPMPEESLGGSRYVFVISDSYSKRLFVSFLSTKAETFDHFVDFKNRREKETQCKIMEIRTDNGSEFVNQKFETLFKEEGIKHQKTTYYTPESNGITERANRTLLEGARTMLVDSQLPNNFWAEAIATAAYTHNCTPTKHGGNKTPMELWTGFTPSVKHFRVFGCIAYYHVNKCQRNKLEPKAKKGIFVGYATNRKAYRVFNKTENKIVEVRDAKFDEQTKGGSFLINNLELKELQNKEYHEMNVWLSVEAPERENPQLDNQDEAVVQGDEEAEDFRPEEYKSRETKESRAEKNKSLREQNEEQLLAMGVRRSERIKNRNSVANVSMTELEAPTSYQEARESSFQEEWQNAMHEEMNSLRIHNVWELVEKREGMKVMKNKWIYTIKRNPDNTIEKRKARLVVAGCNKNRNIPQEDTFAPVIRLESFRMLMAIAAHKNMVIKQYDVKTAYLYADIKDETFMEQPEGYIQKGKETMVCELKKGLYGLAQSGKNWNEKITAELIKCGLKQLECDPCIFVISEGEDLFVLGLYVDDKIVIGTSDEYIDKIMNQLKMIFVLTEKENPSSFLGIEIEETCDGIYLSQEGYVETILKRFGLADCNPSNTAGDPNQDLEEHEQSMAVDVTLYQEMIGSLAYLANGTRPDIAFHVSKLSQYLREPKQVHLVAVKRVYRYLKGSKGKRLFYDRNNGKLNGSADASWNDKPDAKSFSGFVVKLNNSLICWKSKKQSLVAMSTCEAEMMSLCECIREMKWIIGLISELGLIYYVEIPLEVKSDSTSAIAWIKGVGSTGRTKHINRKYCFVKDEYRKGNVKFVFVKSEEMIADFLTKNLCKNRLEYCVSQNGLIDK